VQDGMDGAHHTFDPAPGAAVAIGLCDERHGRQKKSAPPHHRVLNRSFEDLALFDNRSVQREGNDERPSDGGQVKEVHPEPLKSAQKSAGFVDAIPGLHHVDNVCEDRRACQREHLLV